MIDELAAATISPDREAARISAAAIRAAIGDPAKAGKPRVVHIDLARPRRGVWLRMWANLPGLTFDGTEYTHDLLPGWRYTPREMKTEMLEDLELLARTGERPTEATR